MANEVELKLAIDSKDAPLLWRQPCIVAAAIGKPVKHKLITTYYDTPDLKLYKAGISLRIRRTSGQWLQSIKSIEKVQAGLHQRMEWEDVIASGQPDFTKLNKKPLSKIFANQRLRDAINPIFRTEVLRADLQLLLNNEDRIELALDVGNLIIGEIKEQISEVELELKEGSRSRLFELALQLQEAIPLRLKNVSKAQHGYVFYDAALPSVVKGKLPELALRDSAEEAFVKIAWECIRHLQMNQDVVLFGDDVEGVHQMRVAVRRLRSAFSVFKKVLGDTSRELKIELDWLANALGKARDLDVFLTETLPQIMSEFQDHVGLIEIYQRALTAKKEIYIELYEALNSQRYNRLILTLATWLENRGWKEDSNSKNYLLRDIAKAMLDKRHRILHESGKSLASMLPNERHQARITTKKLRYASEFFSSLYSSKKSQLYILRLSQLQDTLGVLNDISTTQRILDQVIKPNPNHNLNEGLHIFAGWNAYRNRCGITQMEESWEKFLDQKPFW